MPPPRQYNLGKRADAARQTRDRILAAAAEAYRDLGISGTSMHEVARRAGVAVGTVINHFPDPDQLATDAINHVIDSFDIPEVEDLVGEPGSRDRIAGLAAQIFELYNRTASWLIIYQRDPEHPAVAAGFDRFGAQMQELLASALGPYADDERAFLVASALLDPSTHGSFSDRGMPTPDSAELVTDMFIAWLHHGRPNAPP